MIAEDWSSASVHGGKFLLFPHSPSDLSASFWQSRVRFRGVCWEGLTPSSPPFSHINRGHISRLQAPKPWVPQSQLQGVPGPIYSPQVLPLCSSWWFVLAEALLRHQGINLLNPFLKLYSFLDSQHLLNKLKSSSHCTTFHRISPLLTAMQFIDFFLLILPQFLQLTSRFFVCLPSHFAYAHPPRQNAHSEVLQSRSGFSSSPEKPFPKFFQAWGAQRSSWASRPYGLMPLCLSPHIVLLEMVNSLVWGVTLNLGVEIAPGKRRGAGKGMN